MNNLEIREKIRVGRVYHYEIAAKLGISEFTLCRWLRDELPEDKRKAVLNAIKEIAGGKD